MKTQISTTLFSAILILSLSAAADVTDGTILAFDRKVRTIVLTDRTVWALDTMESMPAEDLKAGDRIEISYDSDEDGVSAIRNIKVLPLSKPAAGASDSTSGTVLVYDRKKNILVLTDRTVWALDAMTSEIPSALKAGDRIEIEYDSDEDGVSAINSITTKPL